MNALGGIWRRRIYRGWWIVLTCYFAQMLAAGSTGWVFGVLIQPMGEDLDWSRTRVVGAITVSALVGGLLSARLGPLVDRHGPRLLMTGSLVISGTALVLLSQVHATWQYYLLWAIFGVATPGFMHLAPVVAIANWFIRRRALAFMLFTFGSATAGIALAPAMERVSSAFGWRSVWVVMGVMIWMLAPLAWATVRRRPEDVGLLPDGDATPVADDGGADVAPPPPAEVQWTVRQALHTRAYWLLTVGFTLISLPTMSIFIHMSPFIVEKGYGLDVGASVVSVYGVGVLFGRPVWGTLIGRLGLHRSLVLYAASYATVIVAFLIPDGLPAIYATAVLLGVSIAGGQQFQAQSFPDYYGRDIVGTLSGYSGLAYTVTRAAGPVYAAFAYDVSQSYLVAFGSFAAAAFIAAVAFALAPPPRHPGDPEAQPRASDTPEAVTHRA
ncbi:MAG: MFS transporter [Dehalococcoidia bacterium]